MEMVIHMEMKEMKKEVYEVDTELTFGKHKGFTIGDIYSMDFQYLLWMYETFENVTWADKVLALVTDAYDKKEEENRFYNNLDRELQRELGKYLSDFE